MQFGLDSAVTAVLAEAAWGPHVYGRQSHWTHSMVPGKVLVRFTVNLMLMAYASNSINLDWFLLFCIEKN